MVVALIAGLLAGIALGFLIGWLVARNAGAGAAARAEAAETQLAGAQGDLAGKNSEMVRLQGELAAAQTHAQQQQANIEQQRQLIDDAQKHFREAFNVLATEALRQSKEDFFTLASEHFKGFQISATAELEKRHKAIESVVTPVRETLDKVEAQIRNTETKQAEAHGALTKGLSQLAETHEKLQAETRNLVTALRSPTVRGRWGEIQLRKVVEMAGMVEYCDFETQKTTQAADGLQRPDLIVNLPGGKTVVVDAKTPLDAYLRAAEAQDDSQRQSDLQAHARQVGDHIKKLSAKSYWSQFEATPEFVVMFLPGEAFFSAALEQNPSLIQDGVESNVILATPTTLIALLRAISYGWQQERLARDAQQIANLGKELSGRMTTFIDHMQKLGSQLNNAVKSYNNAVGSMESRVLVTARKFSETVGTSAEISELPPIETDVREPRNALPSSDEIEDGS